MQTIVELPKTAKKIKNSKDYVDIDGNIYTYVSNYKGIKTNKVIKKAQRITQGYKYCGVYDCSIKKVKTRRVNRIVAETFIPNPNNYPVVGHKNNIKTDNRVENLYWTTYKENTKKAVKDGLMPQTSGRADSQSKPVIMFETTTNKILGKYGSVSEAVKITGIPQTTICRQAKYHRPTRKPFYFRYEDDISANTNVLIGMYDYDTDVLLRTFF